MALGNGNLGGKNHSALELIGGSPRMQEVNRTIDRVAETDIPVLVEGESGTGKEVVARLLHMKSPRKLFPFVKVNCAAIPRELLESELFGFERGSFTGAYSHRPGRFEMAHRGTIFLDEISEMSPDLQPKLLQVLQDKQFSRLGAQQEVSVDVRLVSATHNQIEQLVAAGRFREDLYYRLNVLTIQLPPLRERKEDILELAQYLIAKHSGAAAEPHVRISDNLIDFFLRYDWPGNVRELENAVRKLLAMGEKATLSENFLLELEEQEGEEPEPDMEEEEQHSSISLKEVSRMAARQAEREMILLTLRKTNWNRKRAAELLQISYKAMLYKLKIAGLAKHCESPAAD